MTEELKPDKPATNKGSIYWRLNPGGEGPHGVAGVRKDRMNQYMTLEEIDALPVGALIQSDNGKLMVVTHHEPGGMLGMMQMPDMMGVIQLGGNFGIDPSPRTMRSLILPSSFRLRRIA